MKERLVTIKKLGFTKIFVAIVSTMIMVMSLCFLVKHICFMQHSSDGDLAFFWRVHQDMDLISEGGSFGMLVKSMFSGLWAFFVALLSLATGARAIFICRTIFPFIFVILMIVEYVYLGYRLFRLEDRGGYYIYVATTCFVTVYTFLMYYLAYNGTAPEGGVYINCWRENVVTGVLLVPLPLCTILRIMSKKAESNDKKNKTLRIKDVILIAFEFILILCVYTFRNISSIILEGHGEFHSILNSNIQISWFFVMVIGFALIGLGIKMKGMIPLLIVVGISLVLLCPLSVGLIIAYGFASLVTHDDKINGWMYLSYIIFGLVVFVLGRVYSGWVRYTCSFGEIQNKYRVEAGIPELCDYITADNDSPSILIVEDWADDMEMYDPNIRIHSLTDFNDENFADGLAGIGEEVDFVCMHRDPCLGEITLYTNGYMFDTVSDDYMVYKRYSE